MSDEEDDDDEYLDEYTERIIVSSSDDDDDDDDDGEHVKQVLNTVSTSIFNENLRTIKPTHTSQWCPTVIKTLQEIMRDRQLQSLKESKDHKYGMFHWFNDTVDVYLYLDKFGVNVARKIHCAMKKLLILVGPNAPSRKAIGCIVRPCQIFLVPELLYNVTHHKLCPRYTVVTDRKSLLARYRVKDATKEFPRMLKTDPVVKYYNWPAGTIVQCHIQWGGCIPMNYETYRIVVKE